MADFISQDASWPGVAGIESLTGTVSHGITPATFILTTYPQTADPAVRGDLAISDGVRTAVFRDCKVDSVSGSASSSGQTYTLTILDRRWKWKYGAISGRYNQLDPRGKLVPWTIRSPFELAELCLKAMGERNYRVHLPAGLTSAAGRNVQRFLELGENFPQSLTNPPTAWDMTPPAEALARLVEQWGCRVIFQPFADRVLIAPLGTGRTLPEGPCEVIAPNIKSPETPAAVGVAGAPVRIQMRLLLEPVGKEWDGSYRPVNELSYAPQSVGQVQIVTVTWSGANPAPSLEVFIRFNPGWELPVPPAGGEKLTTFPDFSPSLPATKLGYIAAAINRDELLSKAMTAVAVGNVLTLTGKAVGLPFSVRVGTDAVAPDGFTVAVAQAPEKPGGNWDACPSPKFAAVRPTDRLAYDQAVQLAQESVYKCYRVLNADPGTGKFPLQVPSVGPIVRRLQLILQASKVDQVEPEPREKGIVRKGPNVVRAIRDAAGGNLPEFYNGYSRDQGPDVFGSVSRRSTSGVWRAEVSPNTNPEDKVYSGFSIDPIEQVVRFSDYLWVDAPVAGTLMRRKFPELVLETAVLVTEATTGEVLRWKTTLPLGGAAPVEWQVREDVQLCVKGKYTPKHLPQGFDLVDLAEATARAKYYLQGAAARFRVTGGETRQYIGIYPIEPDGAVQQVSFSVGSGGATTTASTNSEHSAAIPAYPARRRAENLPPNKAAALANKFEKQIYDAVAFLPGFLKLRV